MGYGRERVCAKVGNGFCYADHKARQFDLLAEAMRQHIDIDKIYTVIQQHQEPVGVSGDGRGVVVEAVMRNLSGVRRRYCISYLTVLDIEMAAKFGII